MIIDLPKSQKKIARELIDKSLQIECARFLEKTEKSISNQTREGKSPHDKYINLYKEVISFDKHIAKRYDDLKGAKYFMIIVEFFLDEILTQEDLNRFDEEVRENLLSAIKLWNEDPGQI